MSEHDIVIRLATIADASTIARHRAQMFADMGLLPVEQHAALERATAEFLAEAFPRGEYVGWLAHPAARTDQVVAGAGAQRRRVSPHPRRDAAGRVAIAEGRHAIVVNVYTEPAWRRRGLAERLMREVLAWSRAEGLDRLVLHAAAAARPLYERLGFVGTNEMQYHDAGP